MNRKGFTLIELLTVFVILGVIMVIAIPTITSSMQRTKVKQNDERKKLILSAAESFVSENKNTVYSVVKAANNTEHKCYIEVSKLVSENYLDDVLSKDMDEKDFGGYVLFVLGNPSSYEYVDSVDSTVAACY